MINFSQMITRVQSLVANHAQATTTKVGEFVNSRHSALLESFDWSRKKQDVIFLTKVDKTAGTVTVALDSSAVVGASTAWAAGDVGRSIIIANLPDSIYTVKAVANATNLTLGDANGSTVTWPAAANSGVAYTMFSQRYSLGIGIEQIIGVKYKDDLRETSEEYLDSIDPSRSSTADSPMYFARTSRGSSDDVRIEIYPRPTSAVAINVKIQKGHTDLSGSQTPLVPSGPIEWFAAEDTCYFLFGKTSDQKWLALAPKYQTNGINALEFEKSEDNKKFGVIQSVKDIQSGVGLENSDFALDHDTGV